MTKVVKGLKKAGKGLLKGVKKVFKQVFKSPVGKILLVAAAVYTGGLALGAWGGASGVAGAAGATSAAGATGAASAAGVGSGVTTGVGATGISTGIGTNVAATGAAGALSSIPAAAPSLLSTVGSSLLNAGKGVADFATANPLLSSVALQGLSGALAPDPAEEEAKRRRQLYGTLDDVGDINISDRYDAKGAIGAQGYLQNRQA